MGAFACAIAFVLPAFALITLLIPHYDKVRQISAVRIFEAGILAAFVGMLGLVLYNFGKTTFVDIPSVIFTLGAFVALLKRIDLSYILLTGAALSILIFGIAI